MAALAARVFQIERKVDRVLYQDVTLKIDRECLELFEQEAARRGVTLSAFLQDAGLLRMAKGDRSLGARPGGDKPHRRKKKFTPGETEVVFDRFITFLNGELLAHRGVAFSCKYSISPANQAPWLPEAQASGESAEENYRMELLFHEKLLEAMETEDEALCLEVVRMAMDWGGVYYNRGVRKGNQQQVEKLHREGGLLPVLRRSFHHIRSRELERLEIFTSGWSIIWYLMDMEGLFILSSRKIYALNKVVQAFQAREDLPELPPELDLGQLVYQGSPRYLDGVRYLYTQKSKLVLFKKCVRILGEIRQRGDFVRNKELDNLLYIMGEA